MIGRALDDCGGGFLSAESVCNDEFGGFLCRAAYRSGYFIRKCDNDSYQTPKLDRDELTRREIE
eukprot:4683871-Karenia_brevis.AAC.1